MSEERLARIENKVDNLAVEASLADQIYLQQNPVTATGVPW